MLRAKATWNSYSEPTLKAAMEPRQIQPPGAHEVVVVHLFDFPDILVEAREPMFQRLGVVQSRVFDIQHREILVSKIGIISPSVVADVVAGEECDFDPRRSCAPDGCGRWYGLGRGPVGVSARWMTSASAR